MKIQWKKLLVLSLAAALLGANIMSMAEESAESRKFSVLSIDGEDAYVTRGAAKEVKASAGMPLGQGSKVRTGAVTTLYVAADNDKTLKLDSNTQAEITKASSKSLKITLKSGEMFFNVDKPLGAGEELTFDAAQTSMSIRGTSGVLGLNGGNVSFMLVEGEVAWTVGNETYTMRAGQKATAIPSSGGQQVSTMNAGYQLQVEDLQWEDLSAMALEAILEQRDNLDLSAIGLDNTAALAQAQSVLQQKKEVAAARDRAQAEKEEAAKQASGGAGGAVIMKAGAEEPEVPVSRNGNSSGGGSAPVAVEQPVTSPDTTTGGSGSSSSSYSTDGRVDSP